MCYGAISCVTKLTHHQYLIAAKTTNYVLAVVFIWANSAYHLGLHCLPKYAFNSTNAIYVRSYYTFLVVRCCICIILCITFTSLYSLQKSQREAHNLTVTFINFGATSHRRRYALIWRHAPTGYTRNVLMWTVGIYFQPQYIPTDVWWMTLLQSCRYRFKRDHSVLGTVKIYRLQIVKHSKEISTHLSMEDYIHHTM